MTSCKCCSDNECNANELSEIKVKLYEDDHPATVSCSPFPRTPQNTSEETQVRTTPCSLHF